MTSVWTNVWKDRRELVEACQGERERFMRFSRSIRTSYSIALRYCGDADVAIDIAQETFLNSSRPSGFRHSSFDSWLYRLVVNSCFDQKPERAHMRYRRILEALQSPARAPS